MANVGANIMGYAAAAPCLLHALLDNPPAAARFHSHVLLSALRTHFKYQCIIPTLYRLNIVMSKSVQTSTAFPLQPCSPASHALLNDPPAAF